MKLVDLDIYEHYILDDNYFPVKVSELRRQQWIDNVHISKIVVAETHLLFINSKKTGTVITTFFTGKTRTPSILCEPYLWRTRITSMKGESVGYVSYEKAREGHEHVVRYVSTLLNYKEKIIVERRDISIPTEE